MLEKNEAVKRLGEATRSKAKKNEGRCAGGVSEVNMAKLAGIAAQRDDADLTVYVQVDASSDFMAVGLGGVAGECHAYSQPVMSSLVTVTVMRVDG
jgi:hypothetical protein